MPEKINWTLNVEVVGGLKMSASETVSVAAYDKVQVTVDAGDVDKVVEVQPGTKKGRVQFLLIKSDRFGDDKLTYKVDSGDAIVLDVPQLPIGDGAVGLLTEAPNETPKSLSFSNGLGDAASDEILVGRNVAD